MDNPEEYYRFYAEDKIRIKGVAIVDKYTKEIERIEIEGMESEAEQENN